MREFEYVIKDKQGIHARLAGLLVKEAAAYPCVVTIVRNGQEADVKRIFELMSLGVKCGQTICIKTEGEKEEEAIASLSKFIQENF